MIAPSNRTANYHYAIRSLVSAAEAQERSGRPVIYLNIGDPQTYGFRPPAHIVEAVARALRDSFTGYAHSAGLPAARKAVAAYATFLGTATVGYTVIDGNGGTNTALITITITNRLPVAVDDTANTPKNISVTVPVLVNDSDPDGDALAIDSVSPTNGTANIVGTNVVFLPATNFLGTATVGYSITDGNGGTNTALITISVTNRLPVAVNDTASTPQNVAVTVPVLVNDSDPDGDTLTIDSVNPTNGTAVISGTNVVFTPATNFLGTATVGYTIIDGNGGTNTALIPTSSAGLISDFGEFPIIHELSAFSPRS